MNLSNRSTWRKFLQENKKVCKSQVLWLLIWFGVTVVFWLFDNGLLVKTFGVLTMKIFGVFPTHYFPECWLLFCLGSFMGKIRKYPFPMPLTVAIVYAGTVFFNFVFLKFQHVFYLLFLMSLGFPFLVGYLCSMWRS